MQPATKHIAVLCENHEYASSWPALFKKIPEPIDLQVAESLSQLFSLVEKRCPGIIILFSNKPDNSVITYLKDIRNKDGETDDTTIFIYTTMPSVDDIKNLLKTVEESERARSQQNEESY